MTGRLITTNQLRIIHGIDKIEQAAQRAYDENVDKMGEFIRSRRLAGEPSLRRRLGDAIYPLTLDQETRTEVESRIRQFIIDRNAAWLSRLQWMAEDEALCSYLALPRKLFHSYIDWLREDHERRGRWCQNRS